MIGQGLAVAAAGVLLGTTLALAGTRVLRSLLYDVAPGDPATFAAIVPLLLATALVATWLPARRTARIPATIALRQE